MHVTVDISCIILFVISLVSLYRCTALLRRGRHTQIFGGSKSAAHDWRSTSNGQ